MAFRPRVEVSCRKKEKRFLEKGFYWSSSCVAEKNTFRPKREMKSQKLEFYKFFSAASKLQL